MAKGVQSNILFGSYNQDVPPGDQLGQTLVWDGQFWLAGIGGSPLYLNPLGGGQDDWPRLNAALAAAAGRQPVVMGAGQWLCATPGVLPSQTVLIAGPNTRIRSTLAFSGGAVLNCVFDTGRPVHTLVTTLAANNTPGASTVSVNASVAAGTVIGIESQAGSKLQWGYYVVQQVAGPGPFTLTLDRPVLNQFATNDKLYSIPAVSRKHDIYLFGNGARISGTGDTALQFWVARDCHAFDWNIDAENGTLGDFTVAHDLGCLDCSFERISVEATGLGAVMSSAETCIFRDCRSGKTLGGLGAFNVFDCQECSLENCEGYAAGAGVIVGSNGTSGGCHGVRISGHYWSNLQGIQVTAGSQKTLVDASCRFNDKGVVAFNAGGTPGIIRVRGDVSANSTLDVDVDAAVIPGFTIEPRTLLFFGAGIVDVGGNTLSLYPGSAPDASIASGSIRPMRVSQGVLRNLRISHAVAGTAGTNITYAVYKNGVLTALSCVVDAGVLSGADTNPAHAVTVAEGDKIAVLETNAAIVASPVGIEATLEHSAF